MAGRYDGLERVRWGGQDGSCYAIARSSVCQLYEATSDKPVATFAHGQPVTDCDFTSSGLVVTGCNDCHVRVWDRRQVEARSMPQTSTQFGSNVTPIRFKRRPNSVLIFFAGFRGASRAAANVRPRQVHRRPRQHHCFCRQRWRGSSH